MGLFVPKGGGGVLNKKGGGGAGGATPALNTGNSSFPFFCDSPNISSAFLIRSSSVKELSTLEPFSGSRLIGGGVVFILLLVFVGMFKGIVLIGSSGGLGVGVGRQPIFGNSRGMVRSAVLEMPEVEALSLPDP